MLACAAGDLHCAHSHRPRRRTASACLRSSNGIPAAGCCGRSAPTTGATGPSRRRPRSPRSPRPSRRASRSPSGVSAAQFQNARARLPRRRARGRDQQQRCLDARLRADLRHRCQGPAPRRRLDLQRLGRPRRRTVLPVGPRRRGGAKGAGDRRRRPLSDLVRARRRRHSRGRPGHLPDHRGMPAQSESQSGT